MSQTMMSRITISRIRKVCSVGFGPRLLRDDLCNMPAYAVIRKDHKSTDDGPGQTGKGTDFPRLKSTPIDTQTGIPVTYRERCQKIIDKAFGSGSAGPDKGPSEQYCSPTINIEDTKREIKEAENARILLEELKNIENPVIPDDRQCGIFKMSRELIKVNDDREITVEENTKKIVPHADTKIRIQKEAPLPELSMKEIELDNLRDHVLNISNPVTSDTVGNKTGAYDDTDAMTSDRVKHVGISAVNPDKKWVLNVTTANENEVKLAQKLETIEEIPLVETQRPEIEGFNVNPKILGDQLNPILTIKSINKGQGISPGHDTLDEAAKRCLNGPLGQLDEMLVKEMDKLGIPLTCKPENKTSTTRGEDKLLQMDLCNEKKQQQQEIYCKSAESEKQDEIGEMVSTTSCSRYHLLSQIRLPDLNEQADEATLLNSEDVEQVKEKDGVPHPEQTKKEIKPVSCDNNPTAKLACSRTPKLDGYEDGMEESHFISLSQDKNVNQTIQKEIENLKHGLSPSAPNAPIPFDVESMQNLHLSIFKQLTERSTPGSNDKNVFVQNTESDRTPHTAKAFKPAIKPTNPSSHHHISSSGEVEYHHDRTLQDHKWDRNIENSPNEHTSIKPCSNKLYADENSECKLNLKPEKVTLPEELMKEHELDPYYVLTCNETCPISPGPSMSTCKNTDFVDTSETIYMKKNICESIRPKPNPNLVNVENLIAGTQAEVNNKISTFGEPKQDATHQDTPQAHQDTPHAAENVQADTQVLHTIDNVQFELVPEITPEIKDLPIVKPGIVSPKQTSLPSKEQVSLTELLRRVRRRNRMQCTRDLGVKVDPTKGECHKKGPRCTPTAPRSPPANPVPPPSFGLPMVKARPKVCVPKKKGGGSKKCTACDIDAICGVQLGNICPEIACEAEACAAVIRVDLTDMVIDHIQNLGKIVVEVLRQMKSNIETLLAREFDPWAPIPSWPIPKKPEKPCEKWIPGISGAPPCVRGCPVFPKARASMNPEPPCTLKPCEGFPKRSSFSALDHFALSLGKNKVYDLGQF